MDDQDVTAEQLIEAAESCTSAGLALGVWTDAGTEGEALFPSNVRGRVESEDLTVPQTGQATVTRVAGDPLVSWALSKNGDRTAIVARKRTTGVCVFEVGEPRDFLTDRLRTVSREVMGI